MLMASRHRSPSPPLTPCPPRGSHEHAYDALVPSRTRLPLVSRFRASSSADAPAPRTGPQIAAFHSDLCSWCRRRRLRLVQQCESLLDPGAHCLSGGDRGLFADAGAHGRLHPHARAHRRRRPRRSRARPSPPPLSRRRTRRAGRMPALLAAVMAEPRIPRRPPHPSSRPRAPTMAIARRPERPVPPRSIRASPDIALDWTAITTASPASGSSRGGG